MPNEPDRYSRYFTVAEANATLPLVRVIVRDLATASRDVIERRDRLSLMRTDRPDGRDDLYSQELSQIEFDLQSDTDALRSYVDELRQIGVDTKSPVDGLVDFPARLDGRTVLLCWKLDEDSVSHWHEVDAGFAGRQSLGDADFDDSRAACDEPKSSPIDN